MDPQVIEKRLQAIVEGKEAVDPNNQVLTYARDRFNATSQKHQQMINALNDARNRLAQLDKAASELEGSAKGYLEDMRHLLTQDTQASKAADVGATPKATRQRKSPPAPVAQQEAETADGAKAGDPGAPPAPPPPPDAGPPPSADEPPPPVSIAARRPRKTKLA